MAPLAHAKPETAIKRADELIAVGKEQAALDGLHDVVKTRRYKVWAQTYEDLMIKHLSLCINLRKSHTAKDALFQYKALAQQTQIGSVEKVVNYYLDVTEQRVEEAQQASIEKAEEIGDLDQGESPEQLLMSVVSGAAFQDRMNRTVLAPWLRFLWDSLRNCLELLRNNSQVEQLYKKIAIKTMDFCVQFERRTEFRKFSDMMRAHLSQIIKQQGTNPMAVRINSSESLLNLQELRLYQLDTATKMELWQDAYRAAEDVHGVLQLSSRKSRRMVKPGSYVTFYDKMAWIFWKAENHLFHAAALLQKFVIYKDLKKQFSMEEAEEQATRVLLATLSIPDGAEMPNELSRLLDAEEQHHKSIRQLTNLLGLPIAPSRKGLLREAARLGILDHANDEARALFHLMETTFTPIRLLGIAEKDLQKVATKKKHDQYIDPLRFAFAGKILKQLATIYESVSWSRLRKILPCFNDLELEHFLAEAGKRRLIKVNIDHHAECVRFDNYEGSFDIEDASGFTGENTPVAIKGVCSHLAKMYAKLKAAVEWLDQDEIISKRREQVKRFISVYRNHQNADYLRIQQRMQKIEKFKQESEDIKGKRLAEEHAEKVKMDESSRNEEQLRLGRMQQEAEQLRKKNELEEIEAKIRSDKIKKLQCNHLYQAILKDYTEEQLAELDPDEFLQEQRLRIDAERQRQQQRLEAQWRSFDYQVRAFHLEESKEMRAVEEVKRQKLPQLFNEYEARRVATLISEHEVALKFWAASEKIRPDALAWNDRVKEERADDFKRKLQLFHKKLEEIRCARLADRAAVRREQRRKEWKIKQARDAERRIEAERQAEQQRREEQKQARQQEKRNNREAESKAMADEDWRGGPRPITQKSERPSDFARKERGSGSASLGQASSTIDSDWRKTAAARQPPPDRSGVDQSSSWRSTVTSETRPPLRSSAERGPAWRAPPAPEPQEPKRYMILKRDMDTPRDFKPIPEPHAEDKWTRGQVVHKSMNSTPRDENKFEDSSENRNVEKGVDNDKTKPPTLGKYVPPARRNKEQMVLTEVTNQSSQAPLQVVDKVLEEELEGASDDGFTVVSKKKKAHKQNAMSPGHQHASRPAATQASRSLSSVHGAKRGTGLKK